VLELRAMIWPQDIFMGSRRLWHKTEAHSNVLDHREINHIGPLGSADFDSADQERLGGGLITPDVDSRRRPRLVLGAREPVSAVDDSIKTAFYDARNAAASSDLS
jgi:hypothetical protein